jgi:hypothetical protein
MTFAALMAIRAGRENDVGESPPNATTYKV